MTRILLHGGIVIGEHGISCHGGLQKVSEPDGPCPANTAVADNEMDRMRLFQAAISNNMEMARKALEKVPADQSDQYGNTALIFASIMGAKGVAKLLIEAGADPDRRDNLGRSARLVAEQAGDQEILNILNGSRKFRPS